MVARDLQVLLDELADLAAIGGEPLTHAYGSEPEQTADLLLPAGDGDHPVAVLLHGGFWRARFTKSTMTALAADLVARGWASWNIEYRRAGNGGGVPETLDDVRAAIAALAQTQAPLDLSRLAIVGHSAGGQLGLCVADEPYVRAVIALAGVCDLASAFAEGIGESAVLEFVGGSPAERPDAYGLADPLARIPGCVPVLLVHGDADQRVPVEQSRRYAAAANAAGGAGCELMEIPGADHFTLIDPRTEAWAAVAARLDTLVP